MKFKQFVSDIESNSAYKDWAGEHGSYLANIFYMRSETVILQAGYYNKKTDKMASIALTEGKLDITEEKEVFKRPETEIQRLVLDEVEIDYEKMQGLLKTFIADSYPKQKLTKEIVILQNGEVENKPHLLWNVTYITDTFKVLNIKVDAKDGNILKHELRSIMEFRTNSPG